MNVRLLRRIAKVIQERRSEFDMAMWHRTPQVHFCCRLNDLPKDKRVGCGTTHCIGGWAQVLSPKKSSGGDAEMEATFLLGLERDQADRLFYVSNWPNKFKGKKDVNKPTPRQAAARIEHFIKTKGAE